MRDQQEKEQYNLWQPSLNIAWLVTKIVTVQADDVAPASCIQQDLYYKSLPAYHHITPSNLLPVHDTLSFNFYIAILQLLWALQCDHPIAVVSQKYFITRYLLVCALTLLFVCVYAAIDATWSKYKATRCPTKLLGSGFSQRRNFHHSEPTLIIDPRSCYRRR